MLQNRRHRVIRTAPQAAIQPNTDEVGKVIRDKMEFVAEAMLQVERLQIAIAEGVSFIDTKMRENKLTVLESERATACYEAKSGRSRTEVDKAALRTVLSDEDFMSVVEVSITKARAALGAKEFESVSTVYPAEEREPELRVTPKRPLTAKKGKKK
jgi:hypothetical protein